MSLSFALTAYDPSDLPGGSIDPLGFERGYLFLADKLLPGLTNVANRPRYFGLLCAGVKLTEMSTSLSPRQAYQERMQSVLRLERLWALANVLARNEAGDDQLPTSGLRGVSYAERKAESISNDRSPRTTGEFKLLSRQVTYGAVGIYGAVAQGMHFWDRKTLLPTPDLGDRLGTAFINETKVPGQIQKAVRESDEREVSVTILRDWGARSHVSAEIGANEAKCLHEAAYRQPVRARMLELLANAPRNPEEPELDRMERVVAVATEQARFSDLAEAMQAILAYEKAYRWALLGFERVLYLGREHMVITPHDLQHDAVLQEACANLPRAVKAALARLDGEGKTDQFRMNLERIRDVITFLSLSADACVDPVKLVDCLMVRHTDIQHGKIDRGRRKAPWIEKQAEGLSMTMRDVGLIDNPENPDQVMPHPYRLASADALILSSNSA